MNAPLDGITVLEMGSSLAGPYGARLLADFGARVIKVEAPGGGDAARSWGTDKLGGTSATYQALNFGKRSIVVDFKNEDEVAVLKRFIAVEADVVLQNLRPGIADSLGLGPDDIRRMNSRIIYCNVSAFGRPGPYAQMPGYDPLIQAFGGIVDLTGPADGDPARVGVPIIDLGTGLWAALGVMAALHTRARTGEGTIVDAAMADTAMAWQTVSQATIEAGGAQPRRSGLTGPLLVPNTGYQTSDGFLIVTVGTDRQFEKLCQVIGHSDIYK
ncbi:MAG: CoA transferase, partial [Pseudomonadota bacterium]